MTEFDDRERAFEAKYAHDAEIQFKAEARRNRKLADWAAGLLGRNSDEYTKELIRADMEEAGADDVVRKLVSDLTGKVDEADIRQKVADFDAEVKDDLLKDG